MSSILFSNIHSSVPQLADGLEMLPFDLPPPPPPPPHIPFAKPKLEHTEKLGDELQLESAFKSAWEMAASQMTNPNASPDDLELAEVEPADAWQQLQDSSEVAAGSSQAVHEATRFALARGVPAFHHKLLPCPEGWLPLTRPFSLSSEMPGVHQKLLPCSEGCLPFVRPGHLFSKGVPALARQMFLY